MPLSDLFPVCNAFAEFRKARDAAPGAYDGESARVHRKIVAAALRGERAEIPDNASDWGIYSEPDGDAAAAGLSRAMIAVVNAILDAPIRRLEDIQRIAAAN